MPLIRDLIDIPEQIHRDDFVLRLAEGVARPAETLRTYVVTPQLAGAFDRALDLIKGGVASGSSKAAYLHGSFGSGKSHFMAVLHLLLQHDAAARATEGLEGVVTRHDDWLANKRFLLVPYHMIGKPSLEAAVLGGYAARVADLHPDAPTPGVYRTEGLFEDARRLRAQIGDETFFARLNEIASSTGEGAAGWGDLSAQWDAASFEAALGAPAGAEERSRLVAALIDSFFRGYRDVARGSDEAFVPLDEGLAVISRHASDLGYDALVLFLDELILWLATHAADLSFLNEEGPKVSKLVEAEAAGRPIPIVSFVARQRDLRELVGEQVTGALQLGFADVLQWWEARFERITLEDRNLPGIAARRLLRPRDQAAARQIDSAYAETEKVRREVFETLLTPRADRAMFRKVYPFSPALVETLVAVSSLLQRERTALKVMLQILVDGRETLDLGEIVPVGDLFDAIAEGDEPFTEGTRHHFENARNLYRRKLLPLIERRHGVSKEHAETRPKSDRAARALRAEDRLAKTLLLSALAPEVEVLKNLTAARLAALNHGSIRTPIEGREGQEVLRRCRAWAAEIVERRRPGTAVPPEREIRLVRVHQDDEVRGSVRQPHAPGLIQRFPQLRDGQRPGQPLEAAEPVAAEDEVRLTHLAESQGHGDLRHRRTERLLDGDASLLLLNRARHLLVHAAQHRRPDRRTKVRVRRVLAGAHLIEQALERTPQIRPRRRPRLEGGIERLEVLRRRVRLDDRSARRRGAAGRGAAVPGSVEDGR